MFQHNNPNIYTSIAYHVWWPGNDPYYNYNIDDPAARVNYYSVTWVPYMVIDGQNDLNQETTITSDWEDRILNNTATAAPLGIDIAAENYSYLSGEGSCLITINPEAGISGNYTLQFVLVEDSLYFMGGNGYPDHHGVMRDMFPDVSGTSVSLEAGIEKTVEVNFIAPFYENHNLISKNSRFVAFIQNPTTREILNAAEVNFQDLFPVDRPLLSISEFEISLLNDDGDEKLNPGESTDFSISIESSCTWGDATDVVGYLSTQDPFVTITDSVVNYGTILACNSISNVSDLFSFTVSELAPNIRDLNFSIRLEANSNNAVTYGAILPVIVKMDLFKIRFPVDVTKPIYVGNASIDLDNDGQKEIIIAGMDSLVHAFKQDGTELAGFPFAVGGWVLSTPAIADIDNDGDLEIVVSCVDNKVYVIQHDGSGAVVTSSSNYLTGTPALDDLDGDGDLEIVVAGFATDLQVIHHDGTPYSGFPINISGGVMSCGVAIADIDNDGSKDIIVGTWSGFLHAISLSGNSLTGFPVELSASIQSPPVVTDMNGDGNLEILVGQDAGRFFAISNVGDTLWTHQVSDDKIRASAALCDLNKNGVMEVVVAAADGQVTILDHFGNNLAGWPQRLGGDCFSSPVVADIDGDNIAEIILGSNSAELYAFHYNGENVLDFPLQLSSSAQGTPTVDDLNGDGSMEVMIGTNHDLSVINLKTPSAIEPTWFTARGNYQRTGKIINTLIATDQEKVIPGRLILEQNFPNPFNSSTTLEFGIPEENFVTLTIYDALGQEVLQLLNTSLSPGNYSIPWNGMDVNGKTVETGIYFAKIKAELNSIVVKMILMK